jgi:carboxyl-terminal processing protease
MKSMPLILALLLSLSSQAAEKKTSEQYWTETGLSLRVLTEQVNVLEPAPCTQRLENFRGCVAAINAVAAQGQPAMRFVPAGSVKEQGFGRVVKAFGDFALVEIVESKTKDSLRVIAERERAKQNRIGAEVEAIFRMSQGSARPPRPGALQEPATNFEDVILEVAKIAIKDPASEALVTASAISAHVAESIDAHARIEAVQEMQDGLNNADQSFTGIGATLELLDESPVIVGPIEGGPAEKAGIKPNDVITHVDGVSVKGMKLSEAVKIIRGPEGSTVKLRLLRDGREVQVSIVRAAIKLENVEGKLVSDFGNAVGVIKLRNFMDRSACSSIGEKIEELTAGGARGLVLDLRGNGGGLVDQAVCIGGLFAGRKVIVKVKDLESDTFEDNTAFNDAVTDLPMVVLIDAGSASASEIVSGAMQDHRRAWILGERSFGKGTVQAPQPFLSRDIVLFRTIKRFYQPLGRTNQLVGISPDFEVPAKPDATADERFRLREADLYPHALGALSGDWKQPRPAEVSAVSACVASGSLAKKAYAAAKASGKAVDYQLLSAEEVLQCGR